MNIVDVVNARRKIDVSAEARFCARAEPRTTKLAEVEAEGVLAAAGIGPAVRRARQLTVAEGRAAVMPLARAEPTPQPGTPVPAARTLESIVGFNDTDQINFLDHGLRAARAVCRLLVDGQPIGTRLPRGAGRAADQPPCDRGRGCRARLRRTVRLCR